MKNNDSREIILDKIKKALEIQMDNPYKDIDMDAPVFVQSSDSLEIQFEKEFTAVSGKFFFSNNENEFLNCFKKIYIENGWKNIFCKEPKIKEYLKNAEIIYSDNEADFLNTEVGITFCEFLVARLGSIMVSSAQPSGRRLFIYPPTHVVIAFTSQLVPDLDQAIAGMRQKYELNNFPSLITNITGPSRTADIEKTLVMGAHGPKEIYVFLINDNK